MFRRENPVDVDPVVAAELKRLEAALAGEPGADPELMRLIAEVRDQAPEPSMGFQADLGRRVEARFARESGRRRLTLPAPRRLLPAMGVVATVTVALIAIQTGGETDRPVSMTAADRVGTSKSATEGAAGAAAPADAPQSLVAPPAESLAKERKVERSAQLGLTTATDELQAVANGVVRETQAVGGYVADSQVSASQSGGSASFTLRIPSRRLDDALKRLSALASVASLSQSSDDITAAFVSARDRLDDARAERRALLRALSRATRAGEISSLRARIAENRTEIASYESELRNIKRRSDLSTVSVDIQGGSSGGAGGAWTPSDALGDALSIVAAIAGGLIVALAITVPAGIAIAFAWLVAGMVASRRRERVLDGS